MIRSHRSFAVAAASGILLIPAVVLAQTGDQAARWRLVDALQRGTRIVITLASGEEITGGFIQSTGVDIAVTVRPGDSSTKSGRETLQKSVIRTVVVRRPNREEAMSGGIIGAVGMLAWVQASASACGKGCENDMPGGAGLLAAGLGAGGGAALGVLLSRRSPPAEVLYPIAIASALSARPRNRHFPGGTSVRVGPSYQQLGFRSTSIRGTAAAPGIAITGQITGAVSLHAEYSAVNAWFYPTPGSVPDEILQNVVPAADRLAGWTRGIERRHVSFVFSELVGIHPWTMGRVRPEALVGVSVRGQQDWNYYDASPGKYKVLEFESDRGGVVYGLDAEVIVSRRIVVVPTLRYTRTKAWMDPYGTLSYGVGAHWRF